MIIHSEHWQKFGETANAQFFEVEPHVLAVVPVEGSTDDEITARASVETQLAYLRQKAQTAGIIIFMDPIAEQTAGARAVYRDEPDPAFQKCFALVGGTFFGRAVGSIFLGLSKPRVPTLMFATFEEARQWCHSMVKEL
jgi:hypothetical protein